MANIAFYINPNAKEFIKDKTDYQHHIHHQFQSPANFVSPGDIIARLLGENPSSEETNKESGVIKILDSGQIKFDPSIRFDKEHLIWTSPVFGFVCLNKSENTLTIIPPIKIIEKQMKAWYIFHTGQRSSSPSALIMIEQGKQINITEFLPVNSILKQISAQKKQPFTAVLIAKGITPKNGVKEHYELLIKREKSVGEIQINGTIDYKSKRTFTFVSKGQPLLKHYPEIPAEDGCDVFGNTLDSEIEVVGRFQPGENLVQDPSDPEYLISTMDGSLVLDKACVSVKEVLEITKDVGYETGHVEFSGSVHIKGAVLAGFHVTAGGDVVIDKDIEDAEITAGGSVTVLMGITGTGKTFVQCGNEIHARFIMNSRVESFGNIFVNESIINSTVLADDSISVLEKHGHIIGGNCCALNEINIKTSGSPKEIETYLEVGKSLKYEKQIKPILELKGSLNEKKKIRLQKITSLYGEEMLRPGRSTRSLIKEMLPQYRKQYLAMLHEIADINTRLKTLYLKQKEIEKLFQMPPHPTIRIQDKIYPQTLIVISGEQLRIEELKQYIRFYCDMQKREIIETPYS